MTKTVKKGFTIVELLIVIVVIGILAAIVLVTYQGVQNKANTTSAEQNARELINKAVAFNAVATVFPNVNELKTAKTAENEEIKEAKLGEKVFELLGNNDLPAATSGTTKSHVAYAHCSDSTNGSATGAVAIYWNYSDNKLAYVKGGETSNTDCKTNIFDKLDADPQQTPTMPSVTP